MAEENDHSETTEDQGTQEKEVQSDDKVIDDALDQLRKSTADKKDTEDDSEDDSEDESEDDDSETSTSDDEDEDSDDEDELDDGEKLSDKEIERRYRYHQEQAKAYRVAKSKGREPIEATQERLKQREQRILDHERGLELKEHLIAAGIPSRAVGLVDQKALKWDGTNLKNPKSMVNGVRETIKALTGTESRPDDKQPGKQSGGGKKDIFDDIASHFRR